MRVAVARGRPQKIISFFVPKNKNLTKIGFGSGPKKLVFFVPKIKKSYKNCNSGAAPKIKILQNFNFETAAQCLKYNF